MKLRTRIIAISCITVFIATAISELFIWFYTGKNLKNEAVLKGMQDFYGLMNELEQQVSENESDIDEIYLDYLFKSYQDDYNVCYLENNNGEYPADEILPEEFVEEAYNHTVFSYERLAGLKFKSYTELAASNYVGKNGGGPEFAYLNFEGRNYAVFSTTIDKRIRLFRIQDITYVQEKMMQMAFAMFIITVAVMTFAIIILLFVLKRELKPLQQLNDTAENIAQGRYNQRIDIKRKDEIGQLGESFNKMAEAVEIRTSSLEESEQRKTIFMGNLTHELKTPMTAISGYAQTLLTAKISEEEQREALLYIYEECGRLERLSKKMMNLLELGQSDELKFELVKAKTLFEAAKKSCKVILEDKNIELQCIEQGEEFFMDRDLMTDVIINLIDNGVKASKPGDKIILRAYDNCIEVQDFGRGIPKEEQEKILEPFYMIDKSRSRKNGGAGLGLALIAVIVKKHGATMTIDSEVGKGSRFVLTFQD